MKKAVIILALALYAESCFLGANVRNIPQKVNSEKAVMVMRKKAGKSDIAIEKKVIFIQYRHLMAEKNFIEDIARYYEKELFDF